MKYLMLGLVLVGCAQKSIKIPEGGGLYPFGTYQHDVKIKIVTPARKMDMRGIVSYTPDSLKVVGLSTFGTTLFRIDENLRTGEIKKEFFMEIMRKNEDKFMEFYRMIREVMMAPKGSTDFKRGDVHFELSQLDANGIYTTIHIEHPQFVIDIKVAHYDL